MSKSHNERRQNIGERCINVYPPETSLGWRVVRMVSPALAAEKLARGVWREVRDEAGGFLGCQILLSCEKEKDLPSRASASAITVRESELNAGLGGQSRTIGLPEDKRICRHDQYGHPLPPEDAIERAIAKIHEYGQRRLIDPIVVMRCRHLAP
jgi:hypothetical protein